MEKTRNHSFKLPWLLLLLFITILIHHQPSSARLLDAADQYYNSPPPPPPPRTHNKPIIIFYMEDVLSNTRYHHDHLPTPSTSVSASTGVNSHQLSYPNYPSGNYPRNGANGNPLPKSNPTRQPFPAVPGEFQNFDPSAAGLSFPAIATLQGLELGTVTPIHEQLMEGRTLFRTSYFGKAKGVYVKSSDNDDDDTYEGHMMAMNVMVAKGGFKDSLRFFGVHQTAVPESHIAVIGGTGKFHGANGYATVKTVTVGLNDVENKAYHGVKKMLMFTVYLSHH